MNKIGWCDMTWNPVIGCKNNCSYCYARRINQRFKFIKNWNEPEWREDSFNKKFPKKSQRIFVGSMSEIRYWNLTWVLDVLAKVEQYPQHTFQFLTKFPQVYLNFSFPKNCWLGVTIADSEDYNYLEYQKFKISNPNNIKFISFEPLLNEISPKFITGIDWVIIGAETGNRKGKVIPRLDWVLEIVRYCEHQKIPVYIKDNLTKYYADCRGYKQFPKVKL